MLLFLYLTTLRSTRLPGSPEAHVVLLRGSALTRAHAHARHADVGRGEPSPGADVGGVSPVPVQMWAGEPSPGVDVAAVPRASLQVRSHAAAQSRQPPACDGAPGTRLCSGVINSRDGRRPADGRSDAQDSALRASTCPRVRGTAVAPVPHAWLTCHIRHTRHVLKGCPLCTQST